jgi:hypothetical protein
VTCTGYSRNAYGIVVEKPEGRPLRITGTDEWNVSKWILKKHDGRVWNGLIWFRIWTSGRLL